MPIVVRPERYFDRIAVRFAGVDSPPEASNPIPEVSTTLEQVTARLVGINHVALEVSDVDAALDWYGRVFAFELRGRAGPNTAFIDMGDQFLALSAPRRQPSDEGRHVGLVVDDKEAARRALDRAGADILPTRGLRFLDPWGNSVEVAQYDEVQFSKTDAVLRGTGLANLTKTDAARAELRDKGLGG